LVRQLRAAGHSIYLPSEFEVGGRSDELHIVGATALGAVLVTHNQRHFAPLHHVWESDSRRHGGIILVVQDEDIRVKFACLDRVARLLTLEAARGQLMYLQMFDSEERAKAYASSLERL
jgi:hypothetical protein